LGNEHRTVAANVLYHSVRYRVSPHFDKVRTFAREIFIYDPRKDLKPSVKMFGQKRRSLRQLMMDDHRISPAFCVNAAAENNAFPKVTDHGKMLVEIHLCHISKDVADRLVGKGRVVKLDH